MDELVNNLKHCLDFFQLPEIEADTTDNTFIHSSINTWKATYDKDNKMTADVIEFNLLTKTSRVYMLDQTNKIKGLIKN